MPINSTVAIAGASLVAGVVATSVYFSDFVRRPSTSTSPRSDARAGSSKKSSTARLDASRPLVEPSAIFEYGFPGPVADLRPSASLVSMFDRRTRNPHWVAEHITRESLATHNADRKHSVFAEDSAIPTKFRARLSDYARSGYDRGHQVPAADAKWSQGAMDSTFCLSNICPQVGEGFNRDYWAHFEDFCRRLTNQYPSVRVVTGPLYLPRRDADGKWRVHYEMIGSPPNVAVPTHFFKVILAEDGHPEGNVSIGAFILPNAQIANNQPLAAFEVPIEVVERGSGLEFARELPIGRQNRLCKQVSCSLVVKEFADMRIKIAKE